jgi:DNA polymerase
MSHPCYHLDFETRSRVDLQKCGAFRYAADPSTEILCAAVAKGDHDPLVWAPKKFGRADSGSRELIDEMVASDAPIYSHNAQFEAAVAAYRTQWNIDPSRWRCTAAMARKAALPSALFAVAKLLGVNQQKDASGTRLIKTFCIPQEGSLKFIEPKEKPVEFCQLMYYCAQDVRAEAAVHKALSKFELSGMSLQVFLADMRINARGMPVNVEALRHAQKLIAAAIGPMTDEFHAITGCNPSQRDAFLKWLEENGCPLDNLKAVTLDEELDDFDFDDTTPVGRALTIKKRLSYAAIKKIDSMIACAGPHDNRVRGTLLYHGAERTGRFSGRLIQPQNFKKPSAHLEAHTENAYRDIMAGCTGEHIEQTYGPVVEVVASSIRHFIHDTEGGDMIDVDYSAIEARIIAWLADEKWRLDVFCTHGKIYEMSAAQMFGIPIESVDKKLRQKGKISELSCGFQGGVGALKNMGALKMGLTEEELPDIVSAWREASPNIVELWYNASRAATNAILNPNCKYTIQGGKVTYFSSVTAGMRYLFAVLPSGRKLAYPQAKVEETCSYRSKEDGKFKVLFSPTEKQKLKALAEDSKAWIKTGPTYGGFPTGKQVWGRNILSPGDLTNNLVQGIAADIMCGGMLNAESHGYETATLIHDEWLGYKKKGQTAEELKNLLTLLPPWAKGLPLAAEGGDVPWYRK